MKPRWDDQHKSRVDIGAMAMGIVMLGYGLKRFDAFPANPTKLDVSITAIVLIFGGALAFPKIVFPFVSMVIGAIPFLSTKGKNGADPQ